jgi:hypothetical protein
LTLTIGLTHFQHPIELLRDMVFRRLKLRGIDPLSAV